MPAGTNPTPKTSHQFGFRSFMLLTLVMAIWLWLFREVRPSELAIFTSFAFATGFAAHLIHTFLLSWRMVGVLSVLLIYNGTLVLLTVVSSGFQSPISESLATIADLVTAPAEIISHATLPHEILFSTVIVAGTILLTPAHAIRPNFVNAMITSLGVGFWYVAGIVVMIYAG